MTGPKRFFECYVPVTSCNLRCSYCYVIQDNRRNAHPILFPYTPEQIGRALSAERMGGTCLFSLTAPGETLIPHEVVDIARYLLAHGHYVNITTNGTLSHRFEDIIAFPADFLERLHFSFSFHYLELVRVRKLEAFFDNMDKVRAAGCSFLVQFNLCDAYLPHLDTIRNLCLERTGALPQVAVTRVETARPMRLMTELSREAYTEVGRSFQSPLFDFGMQNFQVKRKEFCYAGDWSFKLYLHTGELRSCYASKTSQYIFDNPDKPIRFRAIGNNCRSPYCVNATHFMALGVIPEIAAPSYAALRNRPEAHWYNPQTESFLSGKLVDANQRYTAWQKAIANTGEFTRWLVRTPLLRMKRLGQKLTSPSKPDDTV